ncbi:ABC transporter G family member 22 [Hondaea fermentalgiana]|uniref:ABC transporter G family member 22 n=1 Tax=Hondaea fermentalgiana TaxID=2315210 RepID=A0A2R5FZY0_9STRA|nr:ABC transporter G family member 22 [Hondaea fermentalgiana]|eukprot:GBG24326.1 ABC transporter G family member 22 [Hondaea fermentalgiana]
MTLESHLLEEQDTALQDFAAAADQGDVEANAEVARAAVSPDRSAAGGVHVCVETRNLSYFVGSGTSRKQILHDVNVCFRPGELTAIIGPSGSGKTTTISILLGNAAGETRGRVLVNGIDGPPPHFKSVAKLVPQEDVLLASLTVRETLYYQSELVLPEVWSQEMRQARVNEVVEALSLQECLDVRIGTVDERGVSGGQRKRVSIAMDLLSNPATLFVDEPTSGLDSKTAEDVVRILSGLAKEGGRRTIVCTIHQPSYRIFSLFDQLVLLASGRVAYRGPIKDVEAFFEHMGLPTPARENPADHYMRILQDETHQTSLTTEFAKRDKTNESEPALPPMTTATAEALLVASASSSEGDEPGIALRGIARYPTSFRKQLWVLFRRAAYDSLKDRNKFARTVTLKTAVGLLVGWVWWQAGNPARVDKIFPLEGACLMLILNSTIDTIASTIIVFPTQRSLMNREYKNGVYRLMSFYLGLIMSMCVLSIVHVTVMTVPIYFMVGFQPKVDKFFIFATILLLMTMMGNVLGVIVGAISKDLVEAQNALAPMLAPMVISAGYVIPYKQLNKPLRAVYHISFFQFGLSALQLNEFKDLPIEFKVYGYDIPLTGNFILKNFLSLDPETHHVQDYLLRLVAANIVIMTIGYFVVRRRLKQRTG